MKKKLSSALVFIMFVAAINGFYAPFNAGAAGRTEKIYGGAEITIKPGETLILEYKLGLFSGEYPRSGEELAPGYSASSGIYDIQNNYVDAPKIINEDGTALIEYKAPQTPGTVTLTFWETPWMTEAEMDQFLTASDGLNIIAPLVQYRRFEFKIIVEGFDPDNIEKAVLLNNQFGLPLVGHQAVLFVDKNGYGEYYSFAPKLMNNLIMEIMTLLTLSPANPISVPGQMTKISLDKTQTNDFLMNGKIDGQTYNRQISYDVTVENGRAMYDKAMSIFDAQPNYRLSGGQCDDKVGEILRAGGIDYNVLMGPNMSYEYALAKQDPLFDNRSTLGSMGY